MPDSTQKYTVTVTKDKMSAFIGISRDVGAQGITRDAIIRALTESKVVYGILHDEISRLGKYPVFDQDILIAKGSFAEHGADGKVEYLVAAEDGIPAPKVLGDGRVDYKDMNIVHPVTAGTVLCRIHPPTLGKSGFNVLGDEILSKQGRPPKAPRGRNVRLSDDGRELVASVDGQVKRKGGGIEVVQEFEVAKDVDFSTGNIIFPGDVIVRGSVMTGFEIRSGGDVTVYGAVEKANITAVGNIILHGGLNGQNGGALRAGGDIFIKYGENCTLIAGGKITAECIMHSMARAGAGIELIGKKGLLVGGSAKSRDYIKAVTIGSHFATQTELEVGNDPGINDRIKEIKAEKLATEGELIKVRQALMMFAKMESAGVKLTPEKQLIYDRTSSLNYEYEGKLVSLREEHDSLEQRIRTTSHGFVRVSGFIFSGVKILIANNNMIVKEDLQHCTLKSDGDEVRVFSF